MNNIYEGNHPLRKILRCSILEWNLLCHVTYLSNEITNGWCIKSIASLSSYLDLDQSTIRRNLNQLHDKGFIVYETNNHGSRSKPTPIVWEIISADHVDVVIYKDGEPVLGAFLDSKVQKLPVMQNVKAPLQNVNAALVKCQSGVDILHNISKDINKELSKEPIFSKFHDASIARSDTDACTLQNEISVSHSKKELEQQNQTLDIKTQRTRARRAAAEPSETGQSFAKWFSDQTPMKGLTPSISRKWAETCDKLILIGYTKKDVADMCLWALNDSFWSKNFLSASKLLAKNKDDVPYHEIFMLQVRQKRIDEDKLKPKYNEKPYNPTGAHLNE